MARGCEHLPAEVASCLAAYGGRKRLYAILRACASTLVVYLALLLVVSHIDRFSFLATSTRTTLTVVSHLVALLFAGAHVALMVIRRPTTRQLAYEIEARLPSGSEERLVSLNDLAAETADRSGVAQDLMAQLTTETVDQMRGVRAARLATDRALKGWAIALGALLVVCGLMAAAGSYQFGLMVERFVFPGRNLPKPSFVKVAVKPGATVVGRGDELVIQAEVRGEIPAPFSWFIGGASPSANRCALAMRDSSPEPFLFDAETRADMSRIQRGLFVFSRGDLQADVEFQVRCADGQTAVQATRVVAQPEIVDIALGVTPPEYSGLPETTITEVKRNTEFLEGTELVLSFKTDQPVVEQAIVFEDVDPDDAPELEWDDEARAGTCSFTLEKEIALEITVKNAEGFSNVDRVKLRIGVREDRPPAVRLDFPTTDIELVAGELVPLQAVVEDDLGIAELAVRYTLNPSPEQETAPKEFALTLEKESDKNIDVRTPLDLSKTGGVPGDVIAVRLRARDTAGSDGLSREVMVRIVPFTRGENERMRIAALGFVRACAELLAENAPIPSRDGQIVLMSSVHDELSKLAAKRGVHLPRLKEPADLLAAIEREHHLTDAPRHKRAVRELYGVVLDATTREGEGLADLAPPLAELIAYRQTKNLLWRLFGMKYELAGIVERLAELAGQEEPDVDQSRAIKRRAKLYLDTLQDIGDELLVLARGHELLEEKALADLQGQMVSEAYYMKRGSLSRRLTSARGVDARLAAIIAALRPTLVPLAKRERVALDKLNALYAAARSRARATWLAGDARLVSHDPFAGFADHFIARALARAPTMASVDRGTLVTSVVAEGAVERHALDELAIRWEAERVRGLTRISDAEKALELALLSLEWAMSAGAGDDDVASLARRVDTLDLDATEIRPALVAPPGVASALSRLPSAMTAMPDMARERFGVPTPTRGVERLATHADDMGTALGRFVTSTSDADAEIAEQRGMLRKLRDLVAGEERASAGALHDQYLHLTYVAPQSELREADELLYADLRRTLGRHRMRAAQWLTALKAAAGGRPDAAELVALGQQLNILGTLYASLQSRLTKMVARHAAGGPVDPKDRKRFVVLAAFDSTRAYLEATRKLLAGDDARAVALAFVKDFPEVGPLYARQRGSLVHDALSELAAAESAVNATKPDASAFDAACAKASGHLRSFVESLDRLPAAEWTGAITGPVGGAITNVDQLIIAGATLDGTAISKKRYAIAETRSALEGALGAIENAATDGVGSDLGAFRGGPQDIWSTELRRQAEHAADRLGGQVALAQLRVVEGVLEALRDEPRPRAYREAYAWALVLHRLVRGELYGERGARSQAGRRVQGGNPHMRWLMSEIEKALQATDLKHYGAPARLYLKSVRDHLRY